jgi:N-acyl-D-amino-acid deacylase
LIQYTQVTATLDDPAAGARAGLAFQARLAIESGRLLLFNFNAIVVNDEFPEVFRSQLQWLEEVNAKRNPGLWPGLFGADRRHLYVRGLESVRSEPLWCAATLGTLAEKKAKLSDPTIRLALKAEYDSGEFTKSRPYLPFEIEIGTYVAVKLHRRELARYQGLSVAQIAAAERKHVIDAMLDLSVADDLQTEWRPPSSTPDRNMPRRS